MSVYSINETISGLGLEGLKILYDFSSFSGVGQINSVADADAQYSGEIINGDAQFTGQNSGSGYFRDQYIEISNVTGITSESCTIIFSQEKTGVGAATIFSNFNEPSGFELGITTANKLYYKNSIGGTLNYVTFESYPSDKNLYAFSMGSNGGGTLHRLDFKQPDPIPFALSFPNANNPVGGPPSELRPKYYNFKKKDILVPDYTVSNGSSWKIGSGEFLYKGYMDYFLYFDQEFGDDVLRRLVRAVHVETEHVPPVTGAISGIVTGYSVTTSNISGMVGTALSISGTRIPSGQYTFLSGVPVTGAVDISGEVFVPNTVISGVVGTNLLPQTVYRRITNLSITHTLTGGSTVSGLDNYYSSGSYWIFSGNSGTYNGIEGIGPADSLVGITGFEVSTQTGDVSGVGVAIISGSGVSGTQYTGYSFSGLYEPNLTYTGTGGYFTSGPNEDSSYYASALSLMGPPDPLYRYDLLYDISGAQSIEEAAVVQQNTIYGVKTAYMTGTTPMSGVNLYINGVGTFTGKATFGKDRYNSPTVSVLSGFFNKRAQMFTTLELAKNYDVTYDLVLNKAREQLTIIGLETYASAPFGEITEDDNDIFFNGVKLASGIDYIFDGGFRPTGNITGATGVYFTYPSYSGDPTLLHETGFLTQPISVYGDEITPYGYALYFNGIRQSTHNIIEHGKNSDLITGIDINLNSSLVYQMLNGVTQI